MSTDDLAIQGKHAYDVAMQTFDDWAASHADIFEGCSTQYRLTFSLAFCEGWMTANGWSWEGDFWSHEGS